MNRPRNDTLAGAGFSRQQHGGVGASHLLNLDKHVLHSWRIADDMTGALPGLNLFLEIEVFQLQVLKGLLGMPTLGHVPQDDGVKMLAANLQRRERGFHQKFLAVAAAGGQAFGRPQLLRVHRSGLNRQAITFQQVAEALGEQGYE